MATSADRRKRVAVISLHTSPLSQPGTGDAGGMNVYVRELVSSLAQVGVAGTTYVRRWHPELADEVEVEPGFRVVHIPAGPTDLPKEALPGVIDEFTDGVREHITATGGTDVLHANYWLSGVAGHRIKHELDLPLVSTFHTLARVKAETGDPEPQTRIDAESDVIGCSDVILANAEAEAEQLRRLYNAPSDRIQIVPPGVGHAFFSPGNKGGARRALELGAGPVLLFVGRIQPLKGLDIAIQTLAELGDPTATLLAVGGASGAEGQAEVERVLHLADQLDVLDQLVLVDPQPHHELSTFYRAADVLLVPSRSESFGLVALEAAACGLPVVASDVGGLRTLVQHGRTGYRVDGRNPELYAKYVATILRDPGHAEDLGRTAAAMAQTFTWSTTARRLETLYSELAARQPVPCVAV
ncbi:MAG: glycosyltransferase [Acidimicrobiales bacterium]|nr:glycosyltransferase [Acidimicrobiales bacterium]